LNNVYFYCKIGFIESNIVENKINLTVDELLRISKEELKLFK